MLSLDTHAHIKPDIAPRELDVLAACVFAATRSLAEYDQVSGRTDPNIAWGVGCHPGLVGAIRGFEATRFRSCLETAAVVAEIGLDSTSRVPMADQVAVFESAVGILAEEPRIVSIHSYKATGVVVDVLERHRPPGVILHWWLGNEEETARAVEVGAFFSLNASQLRKWPLVARLPQDRVLLETDHPFGDRQTKPQRPGNLIDAEARLGRSLDLTAAATRRLVWQNLKALISRCPAVGALLPKEFQVQLLAL